MQTRKWKKIWKDKDFIILASGSINEENFFESMRAISQTLFGVSNPELLYRFFIPIGVDNDKKTRKKRNGNTRTDYY